MLSAAAPSCRGEAEWLPGGWDALRAEERRSQGDEALLLLLVSLLVSLWPLPFGLTLGFGGEFSEVIRE